MFKQGWNVTSCFKLLRVLRLNAVEGSCLSRERTNNVGKCLLHWILNATHFRTIVLRWRMLQFIRITELHWDWEWNIWKSALNFVLYGKNDFISWIIHKKLAFSPLAFWKNFFLLSFRFSFRFINIENLTRVDVHNFTEKILY